MKKILLVSMNAAAVVLAGCIKNNTPEVILDDMPDSTAQVKYRGNFSNGPYGNVSGEAQIIQTGNRFELKLESFTTSNGPDLRVYLSREIQPLNFIDLGALRATGGNQLYQINGTVDFTQYKYALIHCRQYNHLFGWTLLQ